MRKKEWLSIALVVMLPAMLFTASCAKKAVQTEPVSMTEPEVQETAEVQESPGVSAEETEQPAEVTEDRLWEEAAARLAAKTAFVGENVHFAFDSSVLSDRAQRLLSRKAEYLRTNPDITVTIEGYCDDRGTAAYNIALGERRAESVKSFLVDLGIGSNRVNTVSYGEEMPIAMGRDEASWALNRRAQFALN